MPGTHFGTEGASGNKTKSCSGGACALVEGDVQCLSVEIYPLLPASDKCFNKNSNLVGPSFLYIIVILF